MNFLDTIKGVPMYFIHTNNVCNLKWFIWKKEIVENEPPYRLSNRCRYPLLWIDGRTVRMTLHCQSAIRTFLGLNFSRLSVGQRLKHKFERFSV